MDTFEEFFNSSAVYEDTYKQALKQAFNCGANQNMGLIKELQSFIIDVAFGNIDYPELKAQDLLDTIDKHISEVEK